jgi:glycosyltransferase involved in cell wall biosynthesis
MTKPLVVIQLLPALENGGVERGTIEIANYLAKLGHKSVVISSGGRMQQDLSKKVEHIQLEVGKKSLMSLFLIKKLCEIFINKNANIVHARSRFPAWLAYRAIAKIKTNKPNFITTIHGLYTVKRYSSIMARGDQVIAVSQTALDYVQNNYAQYLKTQPQLIYRGINTKDFPYGYKPDVLWLQKFYETYHQLVGHKIVLMAGRLTALKGAKDLLVWLQSQENDAKLVFTADPEYDFYAAKLFHYFKEHDVENRIAWIKPSNEMKHLYAIANVVVSASKRPESFGRTALEALAIGTPVVAYNHGGVGEILNNIFPQGLVELNNSQALSDKINATLKNKFIVENCQPFQLENMCQKTLNLYEKTHNANK